MNFRSLKIILLLALSAFILSACGQDQQASKEKKHGIIKVGTMGTYEPFSFVNEKNQLTGFDIEVLREISKRNPDLQFEFVASPWDTLFPSLEADRLQVIANQISPTPERIKRYLLTDNNYFNSSSQFIVNGQRSDIKTLNDLKGKKVGLTVGDAHTLSAEEWNEKNGRPFTVVYYEGDLPVILQDIENGRIDATFNSPVGAKDKAKRQGLNIKLIGEELAKTPIHFIFKNDEEGQRLKTMIDTELKAMIDEGVLNQLLLEWFDGPPTQ